MHSGGETRVMALHPRYGSAQTTWGPYRLSLTYVFLVVLRHVSWEHDDNPLVICYIAIENCHIEIVDLPIESCDFL